MGGLTGTPAAAKTTLTPSTHTPDEIARLIVGTWSEVDSDPKSGFYRMRARTTYRANGRFEAAVDAASTRTGGVGLTLSGTWRVQGDMLLMKVEKVESGHPLAFLIPEGKIYTEQLVSVSETHLITRDPETGGNSVAERVK